MAVQQIAIISLVIFIVLIQHVYNWLVRKIWSVLEDNGIFLCIMATFIWAVSTLTLFKLLIEISK